jgi:hypothetical protein
MQYFRFLPDPAKLRKEARWSGVSSVPGIGERVQPSADVGAGTVTAYFVDNGLLGVSSGNGNLRTLRGAVSSWKRVRSHVMRNAGPLAQSSGSPIPVFPQNEL